ncbi:uncharacterized protein LOC128226610 [Mya arenaria]|uniref:uncharacterized protein LOC128226610 n=1 Tax=Mya arenaria TaxID=6604 RepID=UPI0022E1800D|nr:uncharacterized protein LOC128226610 [Mya arenaria]
MLTDEQKKLATTAFENLEERRKGLIRSDRGTLTEAVRLTGLNPTRHEMDQLISVSDLGDTVSKDEFLNMVAQLEWTQPEVTKRVLHGDFAMFIDKNSQTISDEELIHILTREGHETLTTEEAMLIVQRFDRDAQGDLDLQDLIEQMLSVNPR